MVNNESQKKWEVSLQLQPDICSIIHAALDAADPYKAVRENLQIDSGQLIIGKNHFQLNSSSRMILLSLGKAAPAMIAAADDLASIKIAKKICVCKHLPQHRQAGEDIEFISGNHPVPGAGSIRGGLALREAVKGLSNDDVVILLLSGGGSSLATLPADGITLEDMQQLTSGLLRSGATINEINTVRKHIDLFKGGGLLRLAAPARVVSLILSDVVGNPLDVIASGPTVPDPTTFKQALAITNNSKAFSFVPNSIIEYLEKGNRGEIPETVKPEDGIVSNVYNLIVGSNITSCQTVIKKAEELGFHAQLVTTELTGEARLAGEYLANEVALHINDPKPFVLVYGGETTVTIQGDGRGGRNLEVALSAARKLNRMEGITLVTLATDGEDGPTDAAGAVVTGKTIERARSLGVDPEDHLNRNDSYTFFDKAGGLLKTGPTGTNVNDINFIFGI